MSQWSHSCTRIVIGTKQSGEALGDVVLPPWAKGSPNEFIRLHREVRNTIHSTCTCISAYLADNNVNCTVIQTSLLLKFFFLTPVYLSLSLSPSLPLSLHLSSWLGTREWLCLCSPTWVDWSHLRLQADWKGGYEGPQCLPSSLLWGSSWYPPHYTFLVHLLIRLSCFALPL